MLYIYYFNKICFVFSLPGVPKRIRSVSFSNIEYRYECRVESCTTFNRAMAAVAFLFFPLIGIWWEGQKYFISKNLSISSKILSAEYLITERLFLASAPYVPHESFFHQGQKHTILNFIRGICWTRLCC